MGAEEQSQLPSEMLEVVEKITDPKIREAVKSFGQTIVGDTRKTPQPETQKAVAKVVQFPLPFPAETRPASNDLIRSALFAAVQGKHRQHFPDYIRLAAFGDIEIWYKGDQLNQDDHDTFMQMVFMAQHKPLGEDVRVSFRSFLAGLKKKYGSNAREAAAKSIDRLISGTVRLVNKRAGLNYIGHLVHDGIVPSDQPHLPRLERDLIYHINPKLTPYFAHSSFTLIDWQQRRKLKQHDFARWLHLWLASNAEYFPTKVETIREKCGSQAKSIRHFREQLRAALRTLEENCIIRTWHIEKDSDLLHVRTKPSSSQQKHRTKAKPRGRS
jgi:hypothetical protein